MSRSVHVSEPKWGDDPYEEAGRKDFAPMAVNIFLIVLAAGVLALGYWLVSTVTPGRS